MKRSKGRCHSSDTGRIRVFFRTESAGALIELAVAIPFLFLIVVGVVDYARLYYTSITVTNAAQAGAFAGALSTGDANVVTIMRTAAQLDAGSVTLDTVTAGEYCRCPGAGVVSCASTCTGYGEPQQFDSVRVRKDVALIMRYAGFPAAITVTRTAIMRGQ